MWRFIVVLLLGIGSLATTEVQAKDKKSDKTAEDSTKTDNTFTGLKFRSLGPAFMSGRISDIVINPKDENQWYVAVGSGGLWKTDNAGTTWKPIFDEQGSFSIGCITMDPSNSSVLWLGSGENVGGRHVAFGDGVYRTRDGGASWENLGLKASEHIGKILVHPTHPEIVWVAAQGPLWSKGGERGLYKTTDAGTTWKRTLGDSAYIGATDLVIDPRDPNRLYCATWQRGRTVAAYMGGGPGSGIHVSTDGGETWEKLTSGLPGSDMGKIGLAISPQNPDVLYAAIELERRKGAVYRSANRGASWEKGADAVAGGTGPHYYQELYASPHQFDRIYLADVRMQVSEDGGKTFTDLKEDNKHSDNHALAFRTSDPKFLLAGCDGGVYESFDLAETWRFFPNLPVTQFYKVAVDDAAPFYNVYGGTQDNATQGGPSRTVWTRGIQNSDWWLTVGGDGYQPATEPGNPNIVYSQSQGGYLSRVDVATGEQVRIQPQPDPGSPLERFNWDSPILVSPHSSKRLYYASQRVWRSDDRGDSWTALSGDLTRAQNRLELPVMEQTWGWDEPWDVYAMSIYNTITSLAESPLKEGQLYAGTDDGLIQVSDDGGAHWRKMEVASLPKVPSTAFINDIKADLFDSNTVFVVLDNHKYGDFEPYVLKSTDRGKSWVSIRGNLPPRTLTWRLMQDHVKPGLLFLGTEFGLYVTLDGGAKWAKLSGGVPTISFRDLAVQRRENDLVGGSFGRGIYVLDDYRVLRDVSPKQLEEEATLFTPRKAWWYIQRDMDEAQGADDYAAPNPPFGAVFTYYLKDALKTRKDERKEKEEELRKNKKPVTVPAWDSIEAERREEAPQLWLTVSDAGGQVIRRLEATNAKGFQRVAWDLRFPAEDAVSNKAEAKSGAVGSMVAPGQYTVALSKQVDGVVTTLSVPKTFSVERLREGSLPSADPQVTAAFWREVEVFNGNSTALRKSLAKAIERVELLQQVLLRSESAPGTLEGELNGLKQELHEFDERLNGNASKHEIGESEEEKVGEYQDFAWGSASSTYGPTAMNKQSLLAARALYQKIHDELEPLIKTELPELENKVRALGAPWLDGEPMPEKY